MNKKKIWISYFKWLLIQLKNREDVNFTRWNEIFEMLKHLLITNNESQDCIDEYKTPDALRNSIWREIQSDAAWVEANGWPISKNGVGIKLTNNIDELNEFIDGEYLRAMSLLKKISIFKRYIRQEEINKFMSLNSHLFTEEHTI